MPFILILKIIAIIVAGLCFYVSIFIYEDREKAIQNKLEDLWIRIDYAQTQMLSKHTAFMKAIADLMTRGFDYIFGRKLVSSQAIGVTICFANVWIVIGTVVGITVLHKLDPILRESNDSILSSEQIYGIVLGVLYGLFPAYLSHRTWRIRWISWQKIWWLGLLCILYEDLISGPLYFNYILVKFTTHPELVILPTLYLICFAFPMFLFIIFTVLIRISTKKIAQAKSSWKIALIYLLSCLPALILALLFKLWFLKIDYFDFELMDIFYFVLIIFSAAFNLVFILMAAIFALLVLTLLLHRLLWPSLARPTYTLQKYGIAKRSKLLGTIGLLLVFAAFGKLEWLEKIIDKMAP